MGQSRRATLLQLNIQTNVSNKAKAALRGIQSESEKLTKQAGELTKRFSEYTNIPVDVAAAKARDAFRQVRGESEKLAAQAAKLTKQFGSIGVDQAFADGDDLVERLTAKLEVLGREFDDLGIEDASKRAADFADELSKATDPSDVARLKNEVRGLTSELQRAKIEAQAIETDRANTQLRNQVGAVGDVDTAFTTLGSGLSAAGAGGLGGGISAIGELAAVAEGLAQLKGAAPAAAAALKPFVGSLGILAPALLAVVVVSKQFEKSLEDQRRAIRTTLDAQARYRDAVLSATPEEARQTVVDLRAENKLLADDLALVETNLASARDQLNLFGAELPTVGGAFEFATNSLGTIGAPIRAATEGFRGLAGNIPLLGRVGDQIGVAGDSIDASFQGLGRSILNTIPFVGELDQEVKDLQSAISENEQVIQKLEGRFGKTSQAGLFLEGVLGGLTDGLQAYADSQVELERQTKLFIDSATDADQIQARIDSLELEKQSYEDAIAAGELSTELQEEYETQLLEINAALSVLNSQGQARIGQLTAEANLVAALSRGIESAQNAAKSAADAIQRALAQRAQEQQRIAGRSAAAIIKAEDEIANIRQQSAKRSASITATLNANLADFERDRNESLAELNADANEERLKVQRDANQAFIDLDRDLAKQRERIERTATRSLEQAAQDRNAVAAVAAKEQRADQLSDLESDGNDRRAKIQQQLDQQTADISNNLAKQRNEINRQYQQQVADARRAAQTQISLEQQKAQEEISIRQKQISAERAAISELDSAAQQFANNLVQAAQRIRQAGEVRSSAFGSNTQRAQRRSDSQPSSGGNLLTRTIDRGRNLLSRFRSADNGAIVDRPGLTTLNVARGEAAAILRPRQLDAFQNNQSRPMNFSLGDINVNGMGMTRAQIKREIMNGVDRRLEQTLDAAGVPNS